MKKPSINEYAKQHRSSRTTSSTCQTCELAEVAEIVEQFVVAQDSGDPDFKHLPIAGRKGSPSLWTYLREQYGYEFGESALRRHVSQCVRGRKASK